MGGSVFPSPPRTLAVFFRRGTPPVVLMRRPACVPSSPRSLRGAVWRQRRASRPPEGGAVFRSRPPRRPAVSRLLVLVPAVGVLVVRSGVALLSLAVLAVLLLGRSGRSAAVSVRAAAVPVLPLVLVLAVLFLSVGGLSGGRGVLRRGWLWGAALPGGLWVEGGGTHRCACQRAGVPRPRPMPRRRVVAPQAPPSPLAGTRARRGLRGWLWGVLPLVRAGAGGEWGATGRWGARCPHQNGSVPPAGGHPPATTAAVSPAGEWTLVRPRRRRGARRGGGQALGSLPPPLRSCKALPARPADPPAAPMWAALSQANRPETTTTTTAATAAAANPPPPL
ncbi:hypothetical protein BU14_0055s0005 [Porphyra umbilicalis]|uniref:Uncharacterized protein n=1 Tax=Porphyra umbilicalis TaxID=2786 RepID=A0A1X6PHG4_PORUM|nr:hypothetical protein BU14_0055s0005 [Porphyra umbilicalis]|eukprot:OSX80282.1 hypothetical protein BU14_0055s0005 [Porphyra umbilicalis]